MLQSDAIHQTPWCWRHQRQEQRQHGVKASTSGKVAVHPLGLPFTAEKPLGVFLGPDKTDRWATGPLAAM